MAIENIPITLDSDSAPSQSNDIFTYKDKQQVQPGNYITFGYYPQTADGTDNTPIEWLVLDVDEDIHSNGDGPFVHNTFARL